MSDTGNDANTQAAMMATLNEICARMTAMEARLPPTPPAQPLGTHYEVGNNSHEPIREPLEDQDALYRRTRGRGGREDRRQREATPVHVQEEENHEPPPRVQPPLRQAYREEFPRNNPVFTNDFYEGEFHEPRYDEEDEEDWRPVQQRGFPPRRRAPEQDGFGRVKIKIPSFEGKCDADARSEERRVGKECRL